MLDIKLLRDDPELIRRTLAERSVRPFEDLEGADWPADAVERLGALDTEYLGRLHEAEKLRHDQKANSTAMKAVGKLSKDEQGAARAPLIAEGKSLREREKEVTQAMEAAQSKRDRAWALVPNLTHPDSPRGHADEDHRELKRWGEPRDFAAEGFEPLDHLALGEKLELLDFQAGAKVAGQKFYYLKNEAVLLDLALQRYAL